MDRRAGQGGEGGLGVVMLSWSSVSRKSNLLRKSLAYANQIPRALTRLTARSPEYAERRPLVANSFPKSGTHLLIQILRGLPGTEYFGSFIASMPSIPFRERSRKSHRRLINQIVPGEVVGAHIFFDPDYASELAKLNCAHFFIYRDPRDVVVSEAHYLTKMNRWHRLHAHFSKQLKRDDERISASILGVTTHGFPYDYPDIAKRFGRYQGWLGREDVCALKFEDIMSEKRSETLARIISFRSEESRPIPTLRESVSMVEASINPTQSHTFRKGEVGGWRNVFTARHKEEMKSVAGQLLIDLGYERDFNW